MEERKYSFRLQNIVKKYGISYALENVSLHVFEGEVIGLIGANGAGKSTLMSILTGVNPATDGKIEIGGHEYTKEEYNANVARKEHIACCYQELSVCNNLKIYENFAVTIMDHRAFGHRGWRKQLAETAKQILDDVFPDNNIDVHKKVETLSIEQKQMVEICCTLATNDLKILIFDEPTSSLGNERIKQFHAAIEKWRKKGLTIIYISHKLEEIVEISTRIVVMKNGLVTGELNTEDVDIDLLIGIMGGKKDADAENGAKEKRGEKKEDLILDLSHYSDEHLYDISMNIHKGEVVGISGLGGSGQRELLNVIFKEYQKKRNTAMCTTSGSASFVSGDRQHEGIFKLWSISDNLIISSLDHLTNAGLISSYKQEELAKQWYDKLKFRARGPEDNITNLSGGNQQKAIIGRGIASGADLIIFDDPTRGVDAGTKKDIYEILHEIAESGKSVIWYSTEDREMLECDRVYIMRDGTMVDELVGTQISEDAIVSSSFKKAEIRDDKKKKKEPNKVVSFLQSGSGISVLVFAVIWIILSMLNHNVNTRMGMTMMIGSALPLVLLTLGQMFIMGVSDINLGIGNAMGIVNVICATFLATSLGGGLLALVLFALVYVGTAVLIHTRKMPSIVVTLGMSSVWLGAALLIQSTPGGKCPEWLSALYQLKTPVFPIQVYMCVAAAIIAYVLVYRWKFGMIIRGAGDNPDSITKHGWSYLKARCMAYLLSAIFVILAGLALTYQGRGADATSAGSYQMQSIATALLGGCAFAGGIIEPIGAVCGGLSISLISSMLTLMQIHSDYRTGIIGIILILVLFYRELMNRRQRKA